MVAKEAAFDKSIPNLTTTLDQTITVKSDESELLGRLRQGATNGS